VRCTTAEKDAINHTTSAEIEASEEWWGSTSDSAADLLEAWQG